MLPLRTIELESIVTATSVSGDHCLLLENVLERLDCRALIRSSSSGTNLSYPKQSAHTRACVQRTARSAITAMRSSRIGGRLSRPFHALLPSWSSKSAARSVAGSSSYPAIRAKISSADVLSALWRDGMAVAWTRSCHAERPASEALEPPHPRERQLENDVYGLRESTTIDKNMTLIKLENSKHCTPAVDCAVPHDRGGFGRVRLPPHTQTTPAGQREHPTDQRNQWRTETV